MKNTRFIFVLSLAWLVCHWPGMAFVASKDVSIQVKSNGSVTTQLERTELEGGLSAFQIDLKNAGKSDLVIDTIIIRLPIANKLSKDAEVIYGSSCMGRTPLLRETIAKKSKKSDSYMFEMVQAGDEYLFAGMLTWRVFMSTMTVEDNAMVFTVDGEGKVIKAGQTLAFEKFVVSKAKSWLDLLDVYGDAIAQENNITELKKVDFTGWATWDYYGRVFTSVDVMKNVEELKRLAPNSNLLQIDGGWWTQRGDYTSVRDDLAGGIKSLASNIAAAGMTPGLHFDGFRADIASEIYKNHPEYFLHDQDGNVITEQKIKPDRTMNYIYFDFSHPGALAHMKKCVETMRYDWGIKYFKVDFMRYGIEHYIRVACPDVKEIIAHDPTITSIERFRLGMQTIRDAIGLDNYFLGCSAVFGPCIGYVDGMRTGGDVHPIYEAFPERCLANTGNYYLAGKVYNGDADYIVIREAADEDETVSQDSHKSGGQMSMNEAKMWVDYNIMYGTCRLQSDNLPTLRDERKRLFLKAFESPAMEKTVPLDMWERGSDKMDGFQWLLAKRGEDIFLGLFNWTDETKVYDLTNFGSPMSITLGSRHSQVLPYSGSLSFDELCEVMSQPFN